MSPDSREAYVTLQESNGLAVIDVLGGTVEAVRSLGLKDHRQAGQGLDASDKDGGINIKTWPVYGADMPDAVAAFSVGARTYLITANEGDTRDSEGFTDEAKVADLKLDAAAFPDAAALQKPGALGRLAVSRTDGDTDGDGDHDRLIAFGARSARIWTAQGELVADTGDLFERKTAELTPATFNSGGTASTFDTRSDNKGPEPEGVTVGVVGAKTFAFVGLERTGGVMVLDVSTPSAPAFVEYVSGVLDPQAEPKSGAAGDLGPEGLLWIPAQQSPNGQPLLVVSNEVSGSVTVYAVSAAGRLSRTGRYQAEPFAYDKGVAEITAYDPASRRLFVVNGATGGLDLLSLSDPARPTLLKSVDLSAYGAGANSVAVQGGVVALAVEAEVKTDAGQVVFLNSDGQPVAQPVTVGALPDMLTFTPDGAHLLVAGEGEPSSDYRVDPAGTVSIINVQKALARK
ncbi:hypothetical protein SAMN04488058_10948 [Deinococcus reticulitermitis]|uniref:Choice-of-anchor I domain-containing protein n=1 Tax=Deinococcus reticulitermitis TaxID=856736 RepID=A0A1H6Z8V4_9DEIO|nr:choice-of-anchor I family protein [Deinococcus reticulitermitis]SEJ49166.1 hypothetical protein SAMN04488058_10948 [Deinococcus reticulitermitis]